MLNRTRLAVCPRLILALFVLAACGRDAAPQDSGVVPADPVEDAVDAARAEAQEGEEEVPVFASVDEILPEQYLRLWKPWLGDLTGMVERRTIRVLVPFGGYQFYYVRGKPRGAIVELLQRFEDHLNEELGRRHIRVYVVKLPVSRDQMLPNLLDGHADLIAADLTMTESRNASVRFSRPLIRYVNEIIVTGPSAPPLDSLEDLAGQEIVVRESSSYFEHLQNLAREFESQDIAAPLIRKADELLEAEDLLEMVNAGMIPMTVMDEYKAAFWAGVYPELAVRDDLVLNEDGRIGWAMRADNEELAAAVDGFLRKYGRGTLVGNDTFNRYLEDAGRVRCVNAKAMERYPDLTGMFRKYGEMYDLDWLMLVAQGYRESGLRQNRRSHAGAVGIMQIKQSTAADRNVGIPDVEKIDDNIHAAAKYMRFLADRYFSGDIDPLNQWLFSLAAYNAGPARVAKLRNEAANSGYDRNAWFNQVEIIAARRIGHETVSYVSNVYKYYIGYRLAEARVIENRQRHGTDLTGCTTGDPA